MMLFILWLCVALICVNCLNDMQGMTQDWKDLNWFVKAIVLPFVPFFYLAIAGHKAFEK